MHSTQTARQYLQHLLDDIRYVERDPEVSINDYLEAHALLRSTCALALDRGIITAAESRRWQQAAAATTDIHRPASPLEKLQE